MATATEDHLTIPATPEEFTEALLDDDWRAKAFADADTTKEVLQGYNKLVNKADNIAKQTSEQLESTMMKFLKDHGVTDLPTKAEIQKLIPEAKGNGKLSGIYNKYAPGAPADHLDFESIGELTNLIVKDARRDVLPDDARNKIDELRKLAAAYSSDDPASAGFLIPEEMRATILQRALEMSVMRGRATTITMGTKTTDIPYVDVTSHASSLFGGLVFYWTEEAGTITQTEAKFGKVRLEANKLTGGARIPNELLADAPALGSWLNQAMPSGLAWFEDDAFIRGSGVGEPLGFLNSPAVVQHDRATTDTIVPGDLAGMYSRMLPQSLGSAVWVVNQTALPQLFTLTLSDHAAGIVRGGDFTQGPTLSILGRPAIITEKMPALANGAGNEIMFIDPSYYLIGDRQSISIDSSGHSRFSTDETELRIIERVDGRPWIQSALTPAQGSVTLSPFVGLSDT